MTTLPLDSTKTQNERAWPMRLWLAMPDWSFRALGFVFFTSYLFYKCQKYWRLEAGSWKFDFWNQGPSYFFEAGGPVYHMPWVPLLVDLTFVLIALGFCLRLPPRSRAADGWVVGFTLLTAFSPLIPVELPAVLGLFNESWQQSYNSFLWADPISLNRVFIGSTLVTVGNALDLWGYTVLTRSFGIVPEARELKTSGPYHFVRHPVYLGQFISQAGVWLFFAQTNALWIGLYVVFVAMQLYRSKLEDRVLAEAFGEPYREWQQRTFWFV